MTDRELLEFIAAQVGTLTADVNDMKQDIGGLKQDIGGLKQDVGGLKQDVGGLKQDVGGLKQDVGGLKQDLKETKERVIRIENDHGKKLDLLFDGYKQNADKLDRIENEVSRHEEIILRRIK